MTGEHDAATWQFVEMVALSRPANDHVFSAQQKCATDVFVQIWYDFIEKCFFGGKYHR